MRLLVRLTAPARVRPRSRASLVLPLYLMMAGAGGLWSALRGHFNVWRIQHHPDPSPIAGALIGRRLRAAAGGGVAAVGRPVRLGPRLEQDFRDRLGPLTRREMLVLAVASSLGEEILFRGALMPAVGLWLVQPDLRAVARRASSRATCPGPLSALVAGFGFGQLYRWSGDLTGPVLAHFLVNYLNLRHLGQRRDEDVDAVAASAMALLAAGAGAARRPGARPPTSSRAPTSCARCIRRSSASPRAGCRWCRWRSPRGSSEVSVSADGGLRLLPEGDGGPELVPDDAWQVTATARPRRPGCASGRWSGGARGGRAPRRPRAPASGRARGMEAQGVRAGDAVRGGGRGAGSARGAGRRRARPPPGRRPRRRWSGCGPATSWRPPGSTPR